MLKTTQTVHTPTVERLLELWAQRYTPDLSPTSLENTAYYDALRQAASPEGRALTATKLKDNVLDVHCQMAWIQTKNLYAYIPNILDLKEARLITKFAFRVYRKMLEIYQQQSLNPASGNSTEPSDALSAWEMPAIEQLAYALEPILLLFQEQHIISKDWGSLGFMTTQLNLSNVLIIKKLTVAEKVLLGPYLKFIEEQVAIPWQRVCAAGAKYELDSPAFTLVEKMMPASGDIAQTVFRKLVVLLPNHQSRRGGLREPSITHSCIRDLNMFQAYLWLCVLKDSMEPLEQELLPLCKMVVEGVEIKWDMVEQWFNVLGDELISRVNEEQKSLLLPYVKRMREAFLMSDLIWAIEKE
jgi:hypothetical protein